MASLKERKNRSIARLKTLNPVVMTLARLALSNCQKVLDDYCPEAYLIEVTEGIRSAARQEELKALGRSKAGPWKSFHNYGLAVDIAILDRKSQKYEWDPIKSFKYSLKIDPFEIISKEFKRYGFQWGGDWENFVDKPHFQFTFGYSVNVLHSIIETRSLDDLWLRLNSEYLGDIWAK